ncbi:MAG: FhaA domain-containing protein [Candidatus Limnocylindrales bacterium]
MRPFATIERLIERLVERPSARLFRTRVQPVQLQRRLERTMETGRRSSFSGVSVPDHFIIRLHPDDLAPLLPDADSLTTQLADGALMFARAHHYHLAVRPRVAIVGSRAVAAGDIVVEGRFEARPSVAPSGDAPVAPNAALDRVGGRPGPAMALPDGVPGDATMVFTTRPPDPTIALLREVRPGAIDRTVALDGRPITIGRSPDNDVVVADPLVSRHHLRLQSRRGALILTDLESLNGSRVNGIAVTEVALGGGDRIQVGNTVLVVDPASGT